VAVPLFARRPALPFLFCLASRLELPSRWGQAKPSSSTLMRLSMPFVADGANGGLTRLAEAEPPVKSHGGPVVACWSQACRDQLPQEGGSLLYTVLDVDEGTVALRLGDLEQPTFI
jgi:hypothetical protein